MYTTEIKKKTWLRHKQHSTKSRIRPFETFPNTLLKASQRHKKYSSSSKTLLFKYFANILLIFTAMTTLQRSTKSWILSSN